MKSTGASAGAVLDKIDQRILTRLQEDGRVSMAQLARELHISVTPCVERVRRLEKFGYIVGYRADQVQAFLPGPMATATAMYHSGKNPLRKVTRDSEGYRQILPPELVNQYAAMPSFHAGWNLLIRG